METIITIPIVASMVLDLIKSVIKSNDPNFEFSMNFYKIVLPALQVLVAPVMLYFGLIEMLPDYLQIDLSSISAIIQTAFFVMIQSAISVFYHGGVTQKWQLASEVKTLNADLGSLDFDSVVEDLDDRLGE